jgi:glycosyltransferase involved in cell wall biosynthesis
MSEQRFDVGFVMTDALAPDDYFKDMRWLIGGLGELGLKTALLTWKTVRGVDSTDGLPPDLAVFSIEQSAAFASGCKVIHHFGSVFTFESLRLTTGFRNALLVQSMQSHAMHNAIRHRSGLRKRAYLRAVQPWLRKLHMLHFYSKIERERSLLPGCLSQMDHFYGGLGIFPDQTLPDTTRSAEIDADFVVLFFGRNDVKHKGLDILLDGFEMFHRGLRADQATKPLLVMAGRGMPQDVRWIDERIAGSSAPILRLGECSEAERAGLYERADVFVFPTRHDGPPRPIREALKRGCPVLVSHESNMSDVIEANHWGKGFELKPEELAERLRDLFTKPEALRSYREAVRNAPTDLSWKAVAADFAAGYEMGLRRQ